MSNVKLNLDLFDHHITFLVQTPLGLKVGTNYLR